MSDPGFDTLARLLATRHSCRAFRPEPVPHATLERLFRTAQRTASWCNLQPWQVVVLSGAAMERFRAGLQAHAAAHSPAPDIPFPAAYEGDHAERRRTCGRALYASVGIAPGDREASARQGAENFRMFGAPHLAIVTAPRALGTYGAVDCGGYVATVLLLAESLGLAAIAQAAIAGHAPFVRTQLALSEDRLVLCGISLGYEDADHPANRFRTDRADLADVIDWRTSNGDHHA